MARTLDVYLNTDLAGRLTQGDDGDLSFQYAESWLQQPGAVPLSHSLPLRQERFRRKLFVSLPARQPRRTRHAPVAAV